MPSISRIDPVEDYSALDKEFRAMGDCNFCSLLAFCVVTGLPADRVSALFSKLGRKKGKGTNNQITRQAFHITGHTISILTPDTIILTYPGAHRRLRAVTSHHPRRFPSSFNRKGYFMASTTHAWAVKEGQLIDWSINRSLRAVLIWSILPEKRFEGKHLEMLEEFVAEKH